MSFFSFFSRFCRSRSSSRMARLIMRLFSRITSLRGFLAHTFPMAVAWLGWLWWGGGWGGGRCEKWRRDHVSVVGLVDQSAHSDSTRALDSINPYAPQGGMCAWWGAQRKAHGIARCGWVVGEGQRRVCAKQGRDVVEWSVCSIMRQQGEDAPGGDTKRRTHGGFVLGVLGVGRGEGLAVVVVLVMGVGKQWFYHGMCMKWPYNIISPCQTHPASICDGFRPLVFTGPLLGGGTTWGGAQWRAKATRDVVQHKVPAEASERQKKSVYDGKAGLQPS